MSLPIFERLSTLFDMDFEVEEFQLLDLLQALVHKQLKMLWKIFLYYSMQMSSRDVIEREEGIQTIDCLNAGR